MKLIILGAGGCGRTLADLARQSGSYQKIAFLDDQAQGPGILGTCGEFRMFGGEDVEMIPAFGNNEVRLSWLGRLLEAGIRVATLIHPSAYISPEATVGPGCAVLPGAIVNTGSEVREGCILNCGAILDHDCILEPGVHVCLGAIVKAENRIPSCMKIEAGTVVENCSYPL